MITRKCDACGQDVRGAKQVVGVKFNNVEQNGKIKTIRVEDLCYDCQNKIADIFGFHIDSFNGKLKEADNVTKTDIYYSGV